MSDPILSFLQETLDAAAARLNEGFGKPMEIREKPDASLVTDTDVAVERIVIERIRRAFPQDVIFAEESGCSSTQREVGRFVWIIDPLDGTTNFANRYPFFCTSIGRGRFTASGTIEMLEGGIVDPCRYKTYLAKRGAGATCNGQKLAVTRVTSLKKAFLGTGMYYNKPPLLTNEIRKLERVAEDCSSIRRDGAAALDMALVAEGIYDGFWEMGLAPWDVAAGSVIVAEAGGVVANYKDGLVTPFDVETPSLIAANPAVAELLSAKFA